MILFKSSPCFFFLKKCLNCLAKHPERSTPQILRDVSEVAELFKKSRKREASYLFEAIKCRLNQDLLRQDLVLLVEEEIECSNAIEGDEPLSLATFFNESLTPMLEFFESAEVLSLKPLRVDSVNDEDATALVGFFERLTTLESLREVRIKFLSTEAFLKAVEMGLNRLSSAKLQVEIKSIKFDDYDVLASALANGVKLDKLTLPEGYLFLSGKPFGDIMHFLSSLEYPRVSSRFLVYSLTCRALK